MNSQEAFVETVRNKLVGNDAFKGMLLVREFLKLDSFTQKATPKTISINIHYGPYLAGDGTPEINGDLVLFIESNGREFKVVRFDSYYYNMEVEEVVEIIVESFLEETLQPVNLIKLLTKDMI